MGPASNHLRAVTPPVCKPRRRNERRRAKLAGTGLSAYILTIDLAAMLLMRFGALTFLQAKFVHTPVWQSAAGSKPLLPKGQMMATGTVKFFNANKGFGFIEQGGGLPDIFVHISAVERSGLSSLTEGQKINFEVVLDRKSGKNAAENLQGA
jgi:CspA family cold shock protein